MSLILALGSNLGNKLHHLSEARYYINQCFPIKFASRIYLSAPQDYLQQPFFLNQVLECDSPRFYTPWATLKKLKFIEKLMGRKKSPFLKGPRTIDIDIIFYDLCQYTSPNLTIPHSSWSERDFVFLPFSELPFSQKALAHFKSVGGKIPKF